MSTLIPTLLSAHQVAYLPWLGYLHRIALSDLFVILDDVQFEKNSFTNRNLVKTAGGAAWLTIPVHLKGHTKSTIRETRVADGTNWARKHWLTLAQGYAKAPFFGAHRDFFEGVFNREWEHLVDINHVLLKYLLHQFGIETPVVYQSKLGVGGEKQELVLNLCRKLQANQFLFGIMGRDYVDRERFLLHGVKPCFHVYTTAPYPQLWGDFIANLSAVDMLFNVPADELHDRLVAGEWQVAKA